MSPGRRTDVINIMIIFLIVPAELVSSLGLSATSIGLALISVVVGGGGSLLSHVLPRTCSASAFDEPKPPSNGPRSAC
jgi:hypothetical protein